MSTLWRGIQLGCWLWSAPMAAVAGGRDLWWLWLAAILPYALGCLIEAYWSFNAPSS